MMITDLLIICGILRNEDQFIFSFFRVELPALLMLASPRLDGHLGWFIE